MRRRTRVVLDPVTGSSVLARGSVVCGSVAVQSCAHCAARFGCSRFGREDERASQGSASQGKPVEASHDRKSMMLLILRPISLSPIVILVCNLHSSKPAMPEARPRPTRQRPGPRLFKMDPYSFPCSRTTSPLLAPTFASAFASAFAFASDSDSAFMSEPFPSVLSWRSGSAA